MRGIEKRFGDLQALRGVDLTVREGDIHALVGENGAGKSTLMNVLYGLYRADAGSIRYRGREVHITGPRDAIALGIGMIHQHFMLVPPLSVAENVVLGDERGGPALDRRRIEDRVGEIARAMVGRDLRDLKARATPPRTEVVLAVRGLEARSDRGSPALRGVDFEVRAGEILGVAGVGGNGQSELAQCILGLRRPSAGAIRIGDVDISKDDPKRTRARGVAYVPEDRHLEGLVLAFTVADDFILGKQDHAPFARHGVLDPVTILRNGGRGAAGEGGGPPDPPRGGGARAGRE